MYTTYTGCLNILHFDFQMSFMSTEDLAYTDFEEHIVFDLDDPDFSSLKIKDGEYQERHLSDYTAYYSQGK